ncbi:Holliday junction branch migration protein RuvA [Beduinella massiliensis]|uniref:Holliday junction branch migration protein RuvA n=1 Tax=Beduinella massiliensis TaxID=1852363 RepID=UPI000C84F7EA
MYAFIEGKLEEKRQGEIVVNAGGVGYQLICSASTVAEAPQAGERFRAYTYLSVREDAMDLFGFATKEERTMFLKLCSVTGVGARTALGVLSSMPLRDLSIAIATGDTGALSRAPGIGKKTAQRLVLELKDKVEAGELTSGAGQAVPAAAMGAQQEAVAALMALGYSSAEAARAINQVQGQSDKTDQLIMLALRTLGGN